MSAAIMILLISVCYLLSAAGAAADATAIIRDDSSIVFLCVSLQSMLLPFAFLSSLA